MSQTSPPPAAIRKLPVVQTMFEAYGRVFGNPELLARAAAFPFCLSFFLVALAVLGRAQPVMAGLIAILGLAPYTIFGVTWHRVTLLGPQAGRPPLVVPWERRHWRFLGYLIAVTLISNGMAVTIMSVAVIFAPQSAADQSLFALSMVAAIAFIMAYVAVRFCFVFPAVSVDEEYRLAHAWRHTKGQGLRLLAALLLTALPFVLLIWMVGLFFDTLLFPADPGAMGTAEVPGAEPPVSAPLLALSQIVIVALNYVLMALMLSAISISFRDCTGWVPGVGGAVIRGTEED
jgi:hypothetical protein